MNDVRVAIRQLIKNPAFTIIRETWRSEDTRAAQEQRAAADAEIKRLAIFPNSDHLLILTNPDKMPPQIKEFLNTDKPRQGVVS
jgi:hypothetical protein